MKNAEKQAGKRINCRQAQTILKTDSSELLSYKILATSIDVTTDTTLMQFNI